MNDQNREQMSALMDDELSTHELKNGLQQLQQNLELQQQWSRYHLIGDIMKGDKAQAGITPIAARISAQVAEEPAIISAPKRKPLLPQNPNWFRAAAGAGLAASVAALAVVTMPYFVTPAPGERQQLVDSNVTTAPTYVKANVARWKNLSEPDVQSRLNDYLAEHGEYVSPSGVGGVVPYATFVEYDAKR